MKLVDQLSDVLEGLRIRLKGRIEIGHAPFRERLDARSCLLLLTFGAAGARFTKFPSVVGRLRNRSILVTFDRDGLLSVDLVYAGTTRFKVRPDLTTGGSAPAETLAHEDVPKFLARLLPIRRLVFEERLVEYDSAYDASTVTAEEVFDRLDALERLATLLEPPKDIDATTSE